MTTDPRTSSSPRARALSASAFLLVLAASAAAAERPGPPAGPSFGNTTYRGDIETGPQGQDTDVFVGPLLEGETLKVKVLSKFQSPLFPSLEVRDPSGAVAGATVASGRGDKLLRVKSFTVPTTGEWTLEIGANIGTKGNYTLSTKVKPMKRVTLPPIELGGALPETVEIAFPGMDLARLDLSAAWGKTDSEVRLLDLRDPDGNEVLIDGQPVVASAKAKKRSVVLKKASLSGCLGTYRLTIAVAPGGRATAEVRYRVKPTERPSSRRAVKLTTDEPFIEMPTEPVWGVEGRELTIHGRYFSYPTFPRVFVGDAEAVIEDRDEFGNRLVVSPPAGVDGTTVDVTVVNPDGQAFRSPAHFFYVPAPTLTGLENPDGDPVVGGSTAGGERVRLAGTLFLPGVRARFGGVSVSPVLLSDTLMEVVVPAQAAGTVDVAIFDAFEHEALLRSAYRYKQAAAPDLQPYQPRVVAADADGSVRITGDFFDPGDQILLDGTAVPTTYGGAQSLVFRFTALAAGTYPVVHRDVFGFETSLPGLRVKAPGVIASVDVIAGPVRRTKDVPLGGGTRLRVDGTDFDVTDVVSIGGTTVPFESHTPTTFQVIVPAGTPGDADLVITDLPGRSTTETAAVRYVGYRPSSPGRVPARTATDDFSALRGVLADLSDDSADDDLVIVSDTSSPGTRNGRTRALLNESGSLRDNTSTILPSSSAGQYDAPAVAVGDLDGQDGPDIVIAFVPGAGNTSVGEVRCLGNDGSGDFVRETSWEPGSLFAPAVDALDEFGDTVSVTTALTPAGAATAIALGDLDKDGDLDVIVGRDHFESVYEGVDPSVVNFGTDPPSVQSTDAAANRLDRTNYRPATRIYDNRIEDGDGLVDVTRTVFPSAGTSDDTTPLPAFHARDIAVGDVDGDTWPDIVMVWDDPRTVSAKGRTNPSSDSPRIATRILLNDQDGTFTDATSALLPAASSPEYFQGHRVRLADLDGDNDLDIVIVHATDPNAFQASPTFSRHALRILRNDGPTATPRFTDVTATALPGLSSSSDENYRGTALVTGDVDGDGNVDILVGSTASIPSSSSDGTLRATRVLFGNGQMSFVDGTAFLPVRSTDSGEADDLHLGSFTSRPDPDLVLLSETAPDASAGASFLRVFEWIR